MGKNRRFRATQQIHYGWKYTIGSIEKGKTRLAVLGVQNVL
jgi:hypothetical protein